jgi:hypothetical protein
LTPNGRGAADEVFCGEAISALAALPQTEVGPDWKEANADQRDLASDLVEASWPHAFRFALASLRGKKDLHLSYWASKNMTNKVEKDEPVVDDRGGPAGRVDFSDLDQILLRTIHAAAVKYDPGKGLPWLRFLGMCVRTDVADYLRRGPASGGFGTGREMRDYQIPLEDINDFWAPIWEAANSEVDERRRLAHAAGDYRAALTLYLLWWGKDAQNGPMLDYRWHPDVGAAPIAKALSISNRKSPGQGLQATRGDAGAR